MHSFDGIFKSMNPTDFPLPQYLERIGLKEFPKPDEEGLRQKHAIQASSIPFKNLDIHLGRLISLKPEGLVAKLIFGKRGGYCFELNGIYHLAPKGPGFSVQPVPARFPYG